MTVDEVKEIHSKYVSAYQAKDDEEKATAKKKADDETVGAWTTIGLTLTASAATAGLLAYGVKKLRNRFAKNEPTEKPDRTPPKPPSPPSGSTLAARAAAREKSTAQSASQPGSTRSDGSAKAKGAKSTGSEAKSAGAASPEVRAAEVKTPGKTTKEAASSSSLGKWITGRLSDLRSSITRSPDREAEHQKNQRLAELLNDLTLKNRDYRETANKGNYLSELGKLRDQTKKTSESDAALIGNFHDAYLKDNSSRSPYHYFLDTAYPTHKQSTELVKMACARLEKIGCDISTLSNPTKSVQEEMRKILDAREKSNVDKDGGATVRQLRLNAEIFPAVIGEYLARGEAAMGTTSTVPRIERERNLIRALGTRPWIELTVDLQRTAKARAAVATTARSTAKAAEAPTSRPAAVTARPAATSARPPERITTPSRRPGAADTTVARPAVPEPIVILTDTTRGGASDQTRATERPPLKVRGLQIKSVDDAVKMAQTKGASAAAAELMHLTIVRTLADCRTGGTPIDMNKSAPAPPAEQLEAYNAALNGNILAQEEALNANGSPAAKILLREYQAVVVNLEQVDNNLAAGQNFARSLASGGYRTRQDGTLIRVIAGDAAIPSASGSGAGVPRSGEPGEITIAVPAPGEPGGITVTDGAAPSQVPPAEEPIIIIEDETEAAEVNATTAGPPPKGDAVAGPPPAAEATAGAQVNQPGETGRGQTQAPPSGLRGAVANRRQKAEQAGQPQKPAQGATENQAVQQGQGGQPVAGEPTNTPPPAELGGTDGGTAEAEQGLTPGEVAAMRAELRELSLQARQQQAAIPHRPVWDEFARIAQESRGLDMTTAIARSREHLLELMNTSGDLPPNTTLPQYVRGLCIQFEQAGVDAKELTPEVVRQITSEARLQLLKEAMANASLTPAQFVEK